MPLVKACSIKLNFLIKKGPYDPSTYQWFGLDLGITECGICGPKLFRNDPESQLCPDGLQ